LDKKLSVLVYCCNTKYFTTGHIHRAVLRLIVLVCHGQQLDCATVLTEQQGV
jgi:hypothetical protein